MNYRQIRAQAQGKINGRYGTIIGISLLSGLMTAPLTGVAVGVEMLLSPVFGEAVTIVASFIQEMFMIGILFAILGISRDRNPKVEDLFHGFQNFKRYAGIALVYAAVSIVLDIPNNFFDEKITIIYSLAMTILSVVLTFRIALSRYLLLDNENVTMTEALQQSNHMMKGHCMELFGLYFSFIGWYILGIISCGIGFLWIEPWVNVAVAIYYQKRNNDLENNLKEK